MTERVEAELALDARAELGEGPVWDERDGCLYFVDILPGRVHRFDPATRSLSTYMIDRPVGAVGLTERDGLILAVRDAFAWLDLETGDVTTVAQVDRDRPDLRMNDGSCDAAGRFWAGTMALDERTAAGTLYRLEPDGSMAAVVRSVTVSNGIDWSADNRLMYYIDSAAGGVDVFDFDVATGQIANRRSFVRVERRLGWPDGLIVDAEDHVWVALWKGGAVHRYAPDGSLSAIVHVPVSHPTSCCFGGAELRDLYITTASVALDAAERTKQPHAGGLFHCRPGVAGRSSHRFRG
jgi:sugar lactone lactonase YvrE